MDGKFNWIINQQHHILYPGDAALILPGQKFGAENNVLDIGTLSWLHIYVDKHERIGRIILANGAVLQKVKTWPLKKYCY